MDIHIFNQLPPDILRVVLSYDDRFKYRNGQWIGQITKTDDRYELLQKINRTFSTPFDKVSHMVLGTECQLTIFWGFCGNNQVIDFYYRFIKKKQNCIYHLQ